MAATVVVVHVGTGARAPEQGCQWLSSLYGIPPKAFAPHLVAGRAEQVAERVMAFATAGAEHIVTMVADDDAIDHFGELMATGVADSMPGAPGLIPASQLEEVSA